MCNIKLKKLFHKINVKKVILDSYMEDVYG